jgi:serine/threonine protein kinase
LVELLGRGEMAQVWPARNTDTDRIVAIKLLPGHLFDDEEFQWRFRQEAHAAPRSNNPHVPIDSYVESKATSTSVCGLPRAAICKHCAGQLVKASAHANSMAEGSSWSIRPVGTDERGAPRMLQGVRQRCHDFSNR